MKKFVVLIYRSEFGDCSDLSVIATGRAQISKSLLPSSFSIHSQRSHNRANEEQLILVLDAGISSCSLSLQPFSHASFRRMYFPVKDTPPIFQHQPRTMVRPGLLSF
jgi:hypothetical protein